ncbi:MAG: hypothetical protein OEZ10_14200 [Gammaproteobacteria bacterium]|nr:hypothetical protein [Gammaproteobacteria bacterium]
MLPLKHSFWVVAIITGLSCTLSLNAYADRRHNDDHDHGRHRGDNNHDKHRHEHTHTYNHSHPHGVDHDSREHGHRHFAEDRGRQPDVVDRDDRYREPERDERPPTSGRVVTPPPPPAAPAPKAPPSPWKALKQYAKHSFSAEQRRDIKRYYRKTSRRMDLYAPSALPPGTEGRIQRGMAIPHNIPIKKTRSSLDARLKTPPSGYTYGTLGRVVLLYHKQTRVISDYYKVD